jgi:hypothetical protein
MISALSSQPELYDCSSDQEETLVRSGHFELNQDSWMNVTMTSWAAKASRARDRRKAASFTG